MGGKVFLPVRCRFGDAGNAGAVEEVVVEVAAFCAVAAVARVVVVELAAHVKTGGVEVVVEDAVVRAGGGAYLVVRPVFVKRVGSFGVVAHRVEAAHFVFFAAAVNSSGFFAEAVDAVARVVRQVMGDGVAAAAEFIRAGRAVGGERQPFAIFQPFPNELQRAADVQPQLASAKGDAVSVFGNGYRRAAKAFAAVARPPGFAVGGGWRRDEPGSVQRCLAVFL